MICGMIVNRLLEMLLKEGRSRVPLPNEMIGLAARCIQALYAMVSRRSRVSCQVKHVPEIDATERTRRC